MKGLKNVSRELRSLRKSPVTVRFLVLRVYGKHGFVEYISEVSIARVSVDV